MEDLRLRFISILAGVLLLLAMSAIFLSSPSIVFAQQSNAASAISSAQSELVTCYEAARMAERSGANISQLTKTLNDVSSLLSRAELAFSTGDDDSAQNLAIQSQNELTNFISEANSLQTSATQNKLDSFLLNFVGSVSGTFAVIVGSLIVWFLLKRKYGNEGSAKIESEAN
jgi:hypothetical protein